MTVPTSPAQTAAISVGEVPPVELVNDGVWSVPLAIPPGRMPYTLSYALQGSDGIHLVDPGWDTDGNYERVMAFAAEVDRPLRSVIITHLHPDHMGLALRLRDRHGLPLVMHAAEQRATVAMAELYQSPERQRAEVVGWGTPPDRVDEVLSFAREIERVAVIADSLVEEGDAIPIEGREVRVLHTPGHTPGSMCLQDMNTGVVMTGDHVLPHVHPGVGLGGPTPSNPLQDYLHSLERIGQLDAREVLPGHGYRFTGLAERAAHIASHHRARTSQVERVLAEADSAATAWDVASRLTWSRGWDGLARHYIVAALRQTVMHMRLVRDG